MLWEDHRQGAIDDEGWCQVCEAVENVGVDERIVPMGLRSLCEAFDEPQDDALRDEIDEPGDQQGNGQQDDRREGLSQGLANAVL